MLSILAARRTHQENPRWWCEDSTFFQVKQEAGIKNLSFDDQTNKANNQHYFGIVCYINFPTSLRFLLFLCICRGSLTPQALASDVSSTSAPVVASTPPSSAPTLYFLSSHCCSFTCCRSACFTSSFSFSRCRSFFHCCKYCCSCKFDNLCASSFSCSDNSWPANCCCWSSKTNWCSKVNKQHQRQLYWPFFVSLLLFKTLSLLSPSRGFSDHWHASLVISRLQGAEASARTQPTENHCYDDTVFIWLSSGYLDEKRCRVWRKAKQTLPARAENWGQLRISSTGGELKKRTRSQSQR